VNLRVALSYVFLFGAWTAPAKTIGLNLPQSLPDPGTPLDGFHHDVTIFESALETIMKVEIDDSQHPFLPDAGGVVTLPFPAAEGTVNIYDEDGVLSDTLTFSDTAVAGRTGSTKLTFWSNGGDESPAETAAQAEIARAPAGTVCGPSAPNTGACYFVASPSEVPEPSTPGLLAVGLAAAAVFVGARRRRFAPRNL
jgi:hypothetical protein